MEATGVVRKTDDMGRLTLPKYLRSLLKIEYNDGLEISIDGDYIILTKYQPACVLCGSKDVIVEFKEKHLCQECVSVLEEQGQLAKINEP